MTYFNQNRPISYFIKKQFPKKISNYHQIMTLLSLNNLLNGY